LVLVCGALQMVNSEARRMHEGGVLTRGVDVLARHIFSLCA
jgi:hypothetical protein